MIFQLKVKLKDSFQFLEPTTQGYIYSTQQLAKTTKFSPFNKNSLMTCVRYEVARSIECPY